MPYAFITARAEVGKHAHPAIFNVCRVLLHR